MTLNEGSPLNIKCTGNLTVCVCRSVNEMDGSCGVYWGDESLIQGFGEET